MENSSKSDQLRWGIVATVDEPLVLLAAFVAHHLSLGADRIYLYLDRANPETEAFFQAEPCVDIIVCDAAYWAGFGNRPKVHVRRQLINARDAYDRADVDWLLHCDGDEFLLFKHDLRTELAALPGTALSMRVINTERVWLQGHPRTSIFSGARRHPFRRQKGGGWDIYGASDLFLRQGILGYGAGKCFARTGKNLFPGIHSTKRRGADNWVDHASSVHGWESSAGQLVHFDGLTPLHWQVKLLRKSHAMFNKDRLSERVGEARMAQIEFVLEHRGDPAMVAELHDTLRVLDPELSERLRALSLLEDMGFDVAATTAHRFPDAGLDLSEEAFDGWLAQEFPEVVAELRE